MRIAIPNSSGESGVSNFLNRLSKTIDSLGIAKVRTPINPFHDVALYSSVARNYFRKPYVLRLDGIYYDICEKYGSNEKLNHPIYKSIDGASGIIFQSKFSKSLVESHYGKVLTRSKIISNGVYIDSAFNRIKLDTRIKSKEIIILCSARWRGSKRLDAIIKTISKLRDEINCVLYILGDAGDVNVQYDFVKYIGNVSHNKVKNYLHKADLFLHLAWLDNCPNSVIEAIGTRLPVISSNVGGTREIIELTQGGIVSECDEHVDYSTLTDLHSPPEPDYEILVGDILRLLNDYDEVIRNMETEMIDISYVARKYVEYIKNFTKFA